MADFRVNSAAVRQAGFDELDNLEDRLPRRFFSGTSGFSAPSNLLTLIK
jgi:hypothetical protein